MKTTKTIHTAAESLQRAAYQLASQPDAPATRLHSAVLRLHASGRTDRSSNTQEQYESTAAKLCLARWQELPSQAPENPLDDDAVLDRLRLALFGPSPEEQAACIYPKETQID